MAVIRTSAPLLNTSPNGTLERLSASAASAVSVTVSLSIGRGVRGEDCTNPGLWIEHCHVAEHTEGGVMFSFEVRDAGRGEGIDR